MPVVEKVLAYITHEEELLVFEEPEFPEAGIQVPGGTVEADEDWRGAVLREAREETGLDGLELVRFLGAQTYEPVPGQVHRRRYFHLTTKTAPPRAWDHWEMTPSGGDRPIRYRFRWVPLDAVPPLAGARDVFISQLTAGMARELSGPVSSPVRIRYAARVLVFDPASRLLLLNGLDVNGTAYWLAPGGGLQPGEDYVTAALREAREELGLTIELGPLVWHRRHVFETSRGTLDQSERFFVARTQATAIAPIEPDHYVTGHRWWTLEEIAASREVFTPRKLASLLPPLLRDEWPSSPIDIAL